LSNIEPTPFGDKYVLVEHIATGGMAEIYRANYTGIEGFAKELVVKRLREEFEARPNIVRMFLDEARVAATLTHNNVVHTYDLGEIGGEYFIAMELLKGEELVAVLRRSVKSGKLIPLDLALGIIMQSLEGLDYVHRRTDEHGQPLGLVHRDINPTNIHVGYDGVVKIVDFGIAATRATALEGSGRFAGKLGYMAPEQILGEGIDHRADIFALGVVLYEMCLGKRLFRGKPEDLRRRILEGDIPAPTFVNPDFPPALEAIVMRALETDAADRYQNCDHMFRDLESFVHEAGVGTTPRRISAFMAEMFGEGHSADVDYDDEYDDLDSHGLDFDAYDSLAAEQDEDDDAPDWVKSVEAGASNKRSMTIGNLEALVDNLGTGDREAASAAESGVRKQLDPNRASGMHKMVDMTADEDAHEEEAESPAARSGRRARPGGRNPSRAGAAPRMTRRTSALAAVADPGVAGSSFGQSVMTQQGGKKSSAVIWIAALVAMSLIGYIAYSVLTSK
jgi:serine/threonine protein kinase